MFSVQHVNLPNLRPKVQKKLILVANLIADSTPNQYHVVEIDQLTPTALTFLFYRHQLFVPKLHSDDRLALKSCHIEHEAIGRFHIKIVFLPIQKIDENEFVLITRHLIC